jgi:methionyl-tRNA formyltransferase
VRITFLVNHDLPALLALNYLIPALKQHEISVFFSKKKSSNKKIENLKLAELAEFESRQLCQSTSLIGFDEFGARELNKVNTLDYQKFADTKPELVVSIRYMTILKDRAINTPRLGVINLHSGPLPAYQGVMATFWGLCNRERHIGTTLHFIEDNKIDTGSIILASSTEANYQRSYLWNVLNIYRAGCVNIMQAIKQLSLGEPLDASPQSDQVNYSQANYYSVPNPREIDDSGITLFSEQDTVAEFL